MEAQMQQTEVQTANSSEDSTALKTVPESNFSPREQSVKKGQWIVKQIVVFLANIFDYLGSFFTTYKQSLVSLSIILGAIVALRLVLAVMDALNDIPLLAPTFKLIGIGYSVWFVSRYLLKSSTRQELYATLQDFLGRNVSLEDKQS